MSILLWCSSLGRHQEQQHPVSTACWTLISLLARCHHCLHLPSIHRARYYTVHTVYSPEFYLFCILVILHSTQGTFCIWWNSLELFFCRVLHPAALPCLPSKSSTVSEEENYVKNLAPFGNARSLLYVVFVLTENICQWKYEIISVYSILPDYSNNFIFTPVCCNDVWVHSK